jgi:murein DD-endopeptidase MepM/ murein hydrolase activator NlpD
MAFPLKSIPYKSWKTGIRRFGTYRTKTRLHAGCDLYAPEGTDIHAVADGTVIIHREFYKGSWQVTVDHGDFLVRYGECGEKLAPGVSIGAKVMKGQVLGQISKLKGIVNTMIHFEMFSDPKKKGELSNSSSPYNRRNDLIDPTPFLDEWSKEPLPT